MRIDVVKNRLASRAILLLLFLLALAMPHRTHSQTAATPATGTLQPLPQRILYAQVFKQIVFLDYQADLADQRGHDGSKFRNYYQLRAGLTPAEADILKAAAHDALTAVRAVDQQINTVVVIYRQQFPNGKWSAKTPPPPAPPELRTLQTAKNNIILKHVAALQTGFGAARFQHLDAYVQSAVAPHITVTKPNIPARPKPGTLPPLLPVPWK
jgi:hypothetical protein